ncbi:MAG: response regulator transcription factor [Acidimicrobiia bacterium]
MSRILLVADVVWVRNDVRAALSDPDYEVIETADAETAAQAAYHHDVDAVVVDLQVGSRGGMAVTREVRALSHLLDRPAPGVIMLLDRTVDAFLAKRAGADGWMPKPFTARQLRSAIAAAIERPPVPGRPEPADEAPSREPVAQPVADG